MFRTIKQLSQKENRAYSLALASATALDYAVFLSATYAMHKCGCSNGVIAGTTPWIKSVTFLVSNYYFHKFFKKRYDEELDVKEELKRITLSNIVIIGAGMATKAVTQLALMNYGVGPVGSALITYPAIGSITLKIKSVIDGKTGVLKKRQEKSSLESLVEK